MALNFTGAALPQILAFGDTRCEPLENSARPTWVFHSYARMNPAVRGRPVEGNPGREAILLTRD
ncbi:hypothetical protein ACMT4L_03080 [Deinococcus sp. A31D244]|uniref:hypothetical protein n=1 Tax=Deinococcus sp. A31D244 TaxID=3397675 RepID=UPI0039DFF7E3